MSKETFVDICREVGSEGIVLLKNDKNALPLAKGTSVSLFGRIQTNYIKSGTGSGGLVNVDHVVGIPEGLTKAGLCLNQELQKIYAEWEKEHPFDMGNGWASEPWAQEEMPLEDDVVESAAKQSDAALVIIGRTAGEDRDNSAREGSYLLTEIEEDMLAKVTRLFEKVIVVLNVGNIIDMKWIKKYNPSAVLYAWQGGQEGGNSLADIIVGNVSPSGKLSDTIAYDINDYPSTENFGDLKENKYCEDIYVGYRYFNTFAKEKVMYPFGFGLSYTNFALESAEIKKIGDGIKVTVLVKNTGKVKGKEVVQIYCSAPQGKLAKPERVLAAYAKTSVLAPGEKEKLELIFQQKEIASYDATGVTGHKSCFVLEKGIYLVHVSLDAHTDIFDASFEIRDDIVLEQCHQAMVPIQTFESLNGTVQAEPVVIGERILENLPKEIEQTEDRDIKLIDVREGRFSMEEFIAQLTDEDLACIGFGEGMNSPKVTGGTGCAFGGVTSSLLQKGIPLACGTDGPSGLRMDCGAPATSMPNGTLLACTWNDKLIERLYTYESLEMNTNNIDVLLGPGINIHRSPLNGRNFEYFSEDPLLTGRIAVAICEGLAKHGNTATIKHFCCNNQETGRHDVDAVVSERALREIYLKPFEIVVRAGDCCKAVMTSYNPINGTWAAGNYDLNTTILRDEWGYKGFVMSDWWAKTGFENANGRDYVPGAIAQNDIYMVCENAADFNLNNLLEAVQSGRLHRGILQRNAMNICQYLMHSNAIDRRYDISDEIKTGELLAEFDNVEMKSEYEVICKKEGMYVLKADILSMGTALSQNTAIFYANGKYIASATVCGTNGQVVENIRQVKLAEGVNKITVKYPDKALLIEKISVFEEMKSFPKSTDKNAELFSDCEEFYPLLEEIVLKTQEDLPVEQIMEECQETFMRTLYQFHKKKKIANDVPAEVLKLKDFINENIEHELSITDIANSINRSHDYVNRLFKRYCNTTPYAYYIQMRIDRAMELLQHTSLSIKKISEQLGYKNSMYFSKQFYKVTGMTASDYRRMVQSKM